MKNRLKKGMLTESTSEVDASEKTSLKERMSKVDKQSDWASRRMKPTTLSTIQKQEQVLSNTRIKLDINSLNGRKLESRNKQPPDLVDSNPFGDSDEDDNDKNEISSSHDTILDRYHDNDEDVNDITNSNESVDLVLSPFMNNETDSDNIDNDSHGNTNGYNDSNDNSDDFNDTDKNKQELQDNVDTDRLSNDSSNEYNENDEQDSNGNYDDKNDNCNLKDIDNFDTDDYDNNNGEDDMQSQDSLQHLTNKPEGIVVNSDKNYKNTTENENVHENESENLISNNHSSNHLVNTNPFHDNEEKEEVEKEVKISNNNSKKEIIFRPYLDNKNKPIQINSVVSISSENIKPLKSTYSPLYVPKVARQITSQKNDNNNDKKNRSFSTVDVDTIDIYEDKNSRNFNLNTDFSSNPLNKIDETDVNLLYHKVMLSETWLYIALSIHICQFGVLLSLAQEVHM
jgi:CCR4-NOT transcription complex subunit 6